MKNKIGVFAWIVLALAACERHAPESVPEAVRVRYLGHSAFIIEFGSGPKLVIDYGVADVYAEYGYSNPIRSLGRFVPEIAFFSHRHPDHFNPDALPVAARRLEPGQGLDERGLVVKTIPTYERGLDKPDNYSHLFIYRSLRILHLGDCQALIQAVADPQARNLADRLYPERYDLVFVPVGFTSAISRPAAQFVDRLQARRIVPMHAWKAEETEGFLAALLEMGKRDGNRYRIWEAGGDCLELRTEEEPPHEVLLVRFSPAPYPEAKRDSTGLAERIPAVFQ